MLIFLLFMQGFLLMSCSSDSLLTPPPTPFDSSITGRWAPVEVEIKGSTYPYPTKECERFFYEFFDNNTFKKVRFSNCIEQPGILEYYKVRGTILTLGYGTPNSYMVKIENLTATGLILVSREDHYGDGTTVDIKTRYIRND